MQTSTELRIPSSIGELEACFSEPEGAAAAIVLCHPHPQYGGNMHDEVIGTIARVAHEHGFATLKFNFRGVGASAGHFDNGVGEMDDLLAALTWLRDRMGAMPVWLAGYSFGSNIVWRAIERAGELTGVVLIAPPVGMMDFSVRPTSAVAVNIIAGNRDRFVDSADLQRWVTAATPTRSVVPMAVDIIDGADHFFSGSYQALARAAERALTQRGII